MSESSPFLVPVGEGQIRAERAKARELRRSAWWKNKRSSGICAYCGTRVGAHALTMDHRIPIIRGGRTTKGNVVPACKPCNDAKKHRLPSEWAPEGGR